MFWIIRVKHNNPIVERYDIIGKSHSAKDCPVHNINYLSKHSITIQQLLHDDSLNQCRCINEILVCLKDDVVSKIEKYFKDKKIINKNNEPVWYDDQIIVKLFWTEEEYIDEIERNKDKIIDNLKGEYEHIIVLRK